MEVFGEELAGSSLNNLLASNLTKPVLFLSSGGSCIELLDDIAEQSLGPNLTATVLDERYSPDPKINNFTQLSQSSFYQIASRKGARFIDTRPTSGESHLDLARRFEQSLRAWKEKNSGGVIIITQGIGTDGHTAGIFPYPENPQLFSSMFEATLWVIGYETVGRDHFPVRVTTTLTFLKQIVDHSIVYASGEDKRAAVERVFKNVGVISQTPALVVNQMKDPKLYTNLGL